MRTTTRVLFVIAPAATGFLVADPLSSHAQVAEEGLEVIAIQVRKQGFPCSKAVSAGRDDEHATSKRAWILRCADATYHVHLVPRRAAYVERVK